MRKIKTRIAWLVLLLLSVTLMGCHKGTASQMLDRVTGQAGPSIETSNLEPSNLKVHFMDVGQGDSILLQTHNKTMLIDAGTRSSSDKLIKDLKKLGVEKLDVVVATHPHEDHIGGMPSVFKEFRVGKVYAPNASANTKIFQQFVEGVQSQGLKFTQIKRGTIIDFDKGIQVKAVGPVGDTYEDYNNASAVIKVTTGKISYLFTGDAEASSEKQMIDTGDDLSATVLKVGHHGSDTSTSDEFLKAVNPKVCVISVGKDNKYNHPSKSTTEKLLKKDVYRTDISGIITVATDGENISVETER